MTADLLALGDWLDALQVSVGAHEQYRGVLETGVQPAQRLRRTLILVNPQRVLCGSWTQDGRQSVPRG